MSNNHTFYIQQKCVFCKRKQHFAFSAYDRLNGWNKLADKWKEEAHMAWEAQYLGYINKLGYENFLIAMM